MGPARLEDTPVQTHCNFSKDTRGRNDVEKLVMSQYFRHDTADYKIELDLQHFLILQNFYKTKQETNFLKRMDSIHPDISQGSTDLNGLMNGLKVTDGQVSGVRSMLLT